MFKLLSPSVFVEFDTYGNLYFLNDEGSCYQLNIDGKNNPFLDPGSYKIVQPFIENPNINHMNPVTSDTLKGKTLYDLAKEKNIDEDVVDDLMSYFPEESEYIEYKNTNSDDLIDELIDEDNVTMFGEYNRPFLFSENIPNSVPVRSREYGDVAALYDTYVYDLEGLLKFKSSSSFDNSVYRLRVFEEGRIFFRPIGETEKEYKIMDENGQLSIVLS